jgi:penicillin-binding protein 1C
VAQELGPWLPGRHLTALDQRLQQRMQDTLARYVARRAPEGIHNASALLLHAPTLEVRAMVGSARFDDERIQGQVNGVLARRSPGSALKPFVYALAFDQGLIHPLTLMQDLPRRFGGFSPENFDQRFLGPVSAREALILSRNVPAVTLANQLADPDFHQLLTRAGVRDLAAPEHYGLALVLGGAELSMMELAQLYATIPNGGMWRKASFLPARPAPADARAGRRLFSAEAAYLLLDILKDNPPPTGPTSPALHSERNHLAWKTGTSWAFRDAWALGISGPYVLAVWVGNFDGSGNPAFVGRTAAGPLMFELMQQVMPDQRWRIEQALDPADLNLKRVPVCARTGDLAEVHCPERTESWFMPGVSPVRLSHVYRQIPVAIDTGLRHCIHIPGQTQWQTFAFWPSDLAASFAQAGLALKEAPAFAEPCALDQLADLGQAPEIRSPEAELEYVRLADGAQALPLIASADADVASLYWFVDQRFVGQSTPGVALYWTMQPGSHEVLAVDDAGRSRRHRFAVITVD